MDWNAVREHCVSHFCVILLWFSVWHYHATAILQDLEDTCQHPEWMNVLILFLFLVIIVCSNKEKHKSFSVFCWVFCISLRRCPVSFVNTVNNHAEGLLCQFEFGWIHSSSYETGLCLKCEFFSGNDAVNKMYVQYLRDFGWLRGSAVSCC